MIGCVLATTMLPPQPATAGRHAADSTVPTVRIHPGSLPRGVPTSHPRLAGTTIRDAGLRREVPRLARYPLVWMYGPAAHGYLLGAVRRDDAEVELWYVPRGGRAERLRTGDFTLSRIAPSGRIAAFHDRHGRERAQLRTIPGNEPIATYAAARRRTWVDVLDVRRRRALVAVGERLVGWLTPRSEPLRPVARVRLVGERAAQPAARRRAPPCRQGRLRDGSHRPAPHGAVAKRHGRSGSAEHLTGRALPRDHDAPAPAPEAVPTRHPPNARRQAGKAIPRS